MNRILFYVSALFISFSFTANAQDSLAVAAPAPKNIEKAASLNADIAEYRIELATLQTKLSEQAAIAHDKAGTAQNSSAENEDAANTLSKDITDNKKARKSRKAAGRAEDDYDDSKDANRDVEKTQRKIESVNKKIAKAEKKLSKLN